MFRSLTWVLLIAGMGVAEAAPRSEYDFETLPAEIEGVPLRTPIAIANDGAVLFGGAGVGLSGVYKNGLFEPLDVSNPVDFNSSHVIAGNFWFDAFLLNRHGAIDRVERPDGAFIQLTGINDRSAAVGVLFTECPAEICGGECGLWPYCSPTYIKRAIVVVDGAVAPLEIPGTGLYDDSGAIAIDDKGKVLCWSRGRNGDPALTHYLFDGEDFIVLDPPAEVGSLPVQFVDLDNRGQILGTGVDQAGVAQSFIREADGAVRPFEWDHPWPNSLVFHTYFGDVVGWLAQLRGTRVVGINDRGEVLVSAVADYEWVYRYPDILRHTEVVYGVARPRPRH